MIKKKKSNPSYLNCLNPPLLDVKNNPLVEVYMVETNVRLLTVRQFIQTCEGGWPSSESALRAIILDAAWGKNNFQPAFKRVNRRVLVDPVEFWRIVNQMQEGPKDACK